MDYHSDFAENDAQAAVSSPVPAHMIPDVLLVNSSENKRLRQSLPQEKVGEKANIGLNYTYPITGPRGDGHRSHSLKVSWEGALILKCSQREVVWLFELSWRDSIAVNSASFGVSLKGAWGKKPSAAGE
jgi:hypothetical protein